MKKKNGAETILKGAKSRTKRGEMSKWCKETKKRKEADMPERVKEEGKAMRRKKDRTGGRRRTKEPGSAELEGVRKPAPLE